MIGSKVIGSVGERSPQYTYHLIGETTNLHNLLTIDPNFLGHPSKVLKELKYLTFAIVEKDIRYISHATWTFLPSARYLLAVGVFFLAFINRGIQLMVIWGCHYLEDHPN